MLKRVESATQYALNQVKAKTFKGETVVFDTKADGVGFPNKNPELTQDIVKQVNDVKAKIVAGEIKVIPTYKEAKAAGSHPTTCRLWMISDGLCYRDAGDNEGFPAHANDNITLRVQENEIHAILGENGAGKSTLMSVLFGLYTPEEGRILLRGKEVHIKDPNHATALGIGMVHQHFMLVQPFTVAENIILGQPSPRAPLIENLVEVNQRILKASETYGLKIEPQAGVWTLSVGEQQRVES